MKVADSLKTISEQLDILKNSISTFMELNKDEENDTELLTVKNWFQAIKLGNLGNVKVFIKHKFDVNTKDTRGNSALMWASTDGNTEIAKLLIEAGADINTINNSGFTAFAFASKNQHNNNIIKLLDDAKDNLIKSKKATEDDNVKLLTEENWFLAIENKDIDAIKVFIRYKFDINVKDDEGNIALKMSMGHYNILKLLIDAGADINIQDNNGRTVLMTASIYNIIGCAKLLTDNGADINIKDYTSRTAIMWATSNNHTDIVKLLIDANADIAKLIYYNDTTNVLKRIKMIK